MKLHAVCNPTAITFGRYCYHKHTSTQYMAHWLRFWQRLLLYLFISDLSFERPGTIDSNGTTFVANYRWWHQHIILSCPLQWFKLPWPLVCRKYSCGCSRQRYMVKCLQRPLGYSYVKLHQKFNNVRIVNREISCLEYYYFFYMSVWMAVTNVPW